MKMKLGQLVELDFEWGKQHVTDELIDGGVYPPIRDLLLLKKIFGKCVDLDDKTGLFKFYVGENSFSYWLPTYIFQAKGGYSPKFSGHHLTNIFKTKKDGNVQV
jgi:hypothetical protein